MEHVDALISIDKDLDSRIKQLSLTSKKIISQESGTFIVEKQYDKKASNSNIALSNHSKNFPPKENLGRNVNNYKKLINEKKYNPNDYRRKTSVLHEVQKVNQPNENSDGANSAASDDDELEYFMTKETQAKIMALKLKNNYLSQVLAESEKKLKQMITEYNENKRHIKEANKEVMILQKSIKSSKDVIVKKDKELKDTNDKLADKSRLVMELNKKINSFEKTTREGNKKTLAYQTQNNSLKEQLDAAKSKIAILSAENKREKEACSAQLAASEKKCQDLQNEIKSLTCLVKKQDELNIILQQQKSNIAAAKAAKCLEDQFISLIEPYLANQN